MTSTPSERSRSAHSLMRSLCSADVQLYETNAHGTVSDSDSDSGSDSAKPPSRPNSLSRTIILQFNFTHLAPAGIPTSPSSRSCHPPLEPPVKSCLRPPGASFSQTEPGSNPEPPGLRSAPHPASIVSPATPPRIANAAPFAVHPGPSIQNRIVADEGPNSTSSTTTGTAGTSSSDELLHAGRPPRGANIAIRLRSTTAHRGRLA